ncbi:SMP-30/gluconolactonase/LRE family protein [Haladaptatus sp. DYF46]|uniref:SMP-30/gluconolactonase/LRE family protein n=1 Tax=Haladaptatus sp. DYF46 TaxID=2886041 RepID=UPI001E56A2A5|nr:SMP-30/gluconolactonase/LRE family protein [Haladaptatus sp. DYF46]
MAKKTITDLCSGTISRRRVIEGTGAFMGMAATGGVSGGSTSEMSSAKEDESEEYEVIANYDCVTGEGPLWHSTERRVYWGDIPTGRMFRYDPNTGEHEQFYDGDVVGGYTIQEDGSLLLFMEQGKVKRWKDGCLTTVVDGICGEGDSRFNDVIADPKGRVFCGTMPTEDHLGSLYRLDTDGSIVEVLDGMDIPNGMGFTPDRERMYVTESNERKIYLFDYEVETGEISNQTTFVRTPEGDGVPDGLTVDSEGHIWSARYNGGGLYRFSPDGTQERKIDLPAKKTTSITFGGEEYADAYVTSGGGEDKEANGPAAGALFRVETGVTGVPEFRSRITI